MTTGEHPSSIVATFTVNPTVDLSLDVDRLLPEGKSRAQLRSIRAGGGGVNVARCVRRLGGATLAVHTAGREVGERLNRLLDEEGLPHLPVDIGGDTREAFVVADDETACSYHVVPGGPRLSAEEELRCLDVIADTARRCGLLVLSGGATPGLGAGFAAAVARITAATGAKVIADIAGVQLATMLTERTFLIRLDRTEAAALIGRPVTTYADARDANTLLLDRGACEHAVTTVGPLGAVCSDSESHYVISAPPLPTPPRSDACAGDSLVAAIAYRLSTGTDVVGAAELGVAAAAATVMLPGTDVFDLPALAALAAHTHAVRWSGPRVAPDDPQPGTSTRSLA
ncbi:1-phosphofructokinase [Nocardia asteroides NBRC 15531]|uniref:6-phosphofructokinase n=1 Tax=Nocardia asteroides NBRC 15531 TaxID=1110697 RepID=U5E8I2_NOCAS|nr:PfkB family carbohydrate kinase [Nocardia asteroides]TLF67075.1 1-phosphofructokinase [Nocardia asteroides NBRC 15531]UGT51655.1 PfkB family carbohydrate kinase [Nocardia asteroides]SFM20454.1 6-phosphofructokinase 2 [Nocardia asteroides]VEG35442.1 Putative phosphofructokinase pfkB [Nocardia asteroides]GAD86397.1 putative 6-phosphofructokinase [Nocardia asteroides NBRC 15531]